MFSIRCIGGFQLEIPMKSSDEPYRYLLLVLPIEINSHVRSVLSLTRSFEIESLDHHVELVNDSNDLLVPIE